MKESAGASRQGGTGRNGGSSGHPPVGAPGGPGSEPGGEAQQPGHRRLLVLALMLTMALAAMDSTIVSTSVPNIVGDIGGFSIFSWVFSAYLLAQTVTIPVYGKLADLYGRKPVLVAGTLTFLLGSLLCAVAWNMPSLIVFRAVQGLGAGPIQATVLTLAGDLYPLKERGRIQAALSTVWGVAAVGGPALGGAFAEYVSWRWVFLVNLPVGVAALALIVRHLHERRRRGSASVDWLGATVMLGAGVSLILALLQGGVAWSWGSPPSLALLGTAAVLVALTVVVERRAEEPVMPPWVWTRKVLAGINISQLSIGVIMIGPGVFLPVYAQEVLGLGAIQAGLVMATMTMSWPVASAVCSQLYLRIGFRDTALIGAAVATLAAGWMLALPFDPPLWHVVGATLLLGAGLGLFSPTLVVGAQSTVGHRQRGTVTAAVVFSRYLGQSLGAAILGAVSNAALRASLDGAPAGLRGEVPDDVDDIGEVLGSDGALSPEAADYLRRALDLATHRVYVGVTVVCVAAVLLLLVMIPRRFPVSQEEPEAEPGDVRGTEAGTSRAGSTSPTAHG